MTQSSNVVFSKLATATLTTKRPPAISGGKRGVPVAYLTTPIKCTPLASVNPEIASRLNLGTPFELKEVYVFEDADIKEGDIATIDSIDYRVVAVAEWNFTGTDHLHVILEENK